MLIYDRQPRCGVTIIELIIVIGIISFMLGLLIPAVLSSRTESPVILFARITFTKLVLP